MNLRLTWRVLAHLCLAAALLLGGAVASQPTRLRAQPVHRAALVVQHGDERVATACVSFTEETIDGAELIRRSGLPFAIEYGGIGAAVCSIDNEGCDYPATDCFCQCQGANCQYWSYHIMQGGAWVYSQLGASSVRVGDGAMHGWVWGKGSSRGANRTPPALSFADVCSADVPPVRTAPPAVTTPTLVPTLRAEVTVEPVSPPAATPNGAPVPPVGAQPGGATSVPLRPAASAAPAPGQPAAPAPAQPAAPVAPDSNPLGAVAVATEPVAGGSVALPTPNAAAPTAPVSGISTATPRPTLAFDTALQSPVAVSSAVAGAASPAAETGAPPAQMAPANEPAATSVSPYILFGGLVLALLGALLVITRRNQRR